MDKGKFRSLDESQLDEVKGGLSEPHVPKGREQDYMDWLAKKGQMFHQHGHNNDNRPYSGQMDESNPSFAPTQGPRI